jgi:hypothetical protein
MFLISGPVAGDNPFSALSVLRASAVSIVHFLDSASFGVLCDAS